MDKGRITKRNSEFNKILDDKLNEILLKYQKKNKKNKRKENKNKKKINKKIKNININTIKNNVNKEIEKMFQNELFSINKMNGYSSCLYNLICWEMGVIEYHRSIRYFCVNYYDNQILNKEEILLCRQIDNIIIIYNKVKYYCYNYCNEY